MIVELGEQAHRAARLFNFTIKNHALEHVALDSQEVNPSWVWTFASEGFLGKVRKLVASSFTWKLSSQSAHKSDEELCWSPSWRAGCCMEMDVKKGMAIAGLAHRKHKQA